MIDTYLKTIAAITKRGDAREESYYGSLATLLEEYSSVHGKRTIHVTTIPSKTEGGNPDFRVWDGKHSIVGYIEAKKPDINLEDVEDTEQIQRYIETFPNFILTNFYEFWLYRNGKRVDKVLLARSFIASKLRTVPPAEHEQDFFALLKKFFDYSRPRRYAAESLARELAVLTRFLRDEIIKGQLAEEQTKGEGALFGFYKAFRDTLIANLTAEEFADLYAQTLTYGLFAARTRSENSFNRKLAYTLIPKTIGILRDIFRFISIEEPPQQLEWIVDDIAEVLAVADVKEILSEYFKKGKGADPIYHFYETFLAEYNPAERERRGVYYTPEPVVSYIVRSLNIILKETFGREAGFGTPSVTVLDPAAGTLTFLAEASKLAVDEFVKMYGTSRKKVIENHVLKNFYAFELMMAPYAAGHLKIGYLLEELGHKLKDDERFQFYLTNTLDMEELAQTTLPGMSSLSEESHFAEELKKEKPILIILGNPPYSVSSANKSKFIEEEMKLYKEAVKDERNIQPLSDDYIKFIRFAHWKIEQVEEGAIGFITNNSYLSGIIHRGMREELMRTFNDIYILNLHGNARLGEKPPDGGVDENVFDIMQGVAIAIFIKSNSKKRKIYYQDLFGTRETKYKFLNKHDISNTRWQLVIPHSESFFFFPFDDKLSASYQKFVGINDIFRYYSLGVTTARDEFVVGFSKPELKQRVKVFANSADWQIAAKTFHLSDTVDWTAEGAWEKIRDEDWEREIIPYGYRPFDERNIIYTPTFIERDRFDIMQHLLKRPNIALNVTRRLRDPKWKHIFASSTVTDKTILSAKDNCYTMPLYLFYDRTPGAGGRASGKLSAQAVLLFEPEASYSNREANLDSEFLEMLEEKYGKRPEPETIFYYIYSVLYSNAYRKKYAEFLKTDFPRVPFTTNYKLFQSLAARGEELVALHLLKSKKLNNPIARCEGSGESVVEKVTYDEKQKRVNINPSKYFTSIPKDVWEYHIGGYQVAEKWLKDRRGRTLSAEDFLHYCKAVTALAETIKIQEALDELFEGVEKSLLEIKMKELTLASPNI